MTSATLSPGFSPALSLRAQLAYLPDVARLEWAWHRAFHAADRAPLALERLAAVPPERYGQVRFRLHPSAQFIASDYPLLRIWEVNQPAYAGEAATGGSLIWLDDERRGFLSHRGPRLDPIADVAG